MATPDGDESIEITVTSERIARDRAKGRLPSATGDKKKDSKSAYYEFVDLLKFSLSSSYLKETWDRDCLDLSRFPPDLCLQWPKKSKTTSKVWFFDNQEDSEKGRYRTVYAFICESASKDARIYRWDVNLFEDNSEKKLSVLHMELSYWLVYWKTSLSPGAAPLSNETEYWDPETGEKPARMGTSKSSSSSGSARKSSTLKPHEPEMRTGSQSSRRHPNSNHYEVSRALSQKSGQIFSREEIS
jgi:hypothetical protein